MKKIPLLITVGVILLIAGGYFLYTKFLNNRTVEVWDLIPRNTVLIYERNECKSCLEDIQKSPVWQIIEKASFFNKSLDSLKKPLIQTLQASGRLLVSLHATKKDDFDFVFYLPGASTRLNDMASLLEKKSYKFTKRAFNGIEIHEIIFLKETFSWAFIGDVWVGSFTPFLVEDVIRTSIRKNGIEKNAAQVQQLPAIKADAGNIYVQLNNFSEWLTLFYEDREVPQKFGRYSSLDIKADPDYIALSGFSLDTTDRSRYLLSIFHNQSPVSFNLKDMVSNRTVSLHSFGVSDGMSFKNDLRLFGKKHRPELLDSLEFVGNKSKVDFSDLYNNIHEEVGLCYLESSKSSRFSRVLLIETKKPKVWTTALNKIAETFSVDTIFYDRYGNYEIREVPVFRFPEKFLWPLVTQFNQSFYTSHQNTIIIADNLQDLKTFLNDIDEEDTWGKSVTHNKFLESTLLESNLSFYFNTPKIWNLLSQQLKPKWRQFVRENSVLLRSVLLSAIQFSHLNNSYYTNISINYKPAPLGAVPGVIKREKFITNFTTGIQGLYAVKSHVNRGDEILIQDSLNDLSLVSENGSVLWKTPLGDNITSEVTQIDFFGNGKLQYFFTTRAGLHIIDRLGNNVDPFPALLSSIEFEYAVVVDYEHNKKYRFLAADKSGKLWLYDKEMNNLEGWQPKDTGGPLACAPGHHRIKGKDYIVAIRKDGKVLIMNRRGENLKNFPLDLEARISGDYFLDPGNSPSDTYFFVVSDDGYKIKFSLDGKIQSRETLLKTSVSSRFRLIAEKNLRTFLILQQDAGRINIFDADGRKIISNESIGQNQVSVNYYDFGSGRIYVSLIDKIQGLGYLYDGAGNLISNPPIESSTIELRPKDADENRLFFVQGKTLTIQLINR